MSFLNVDYKTRDKLVKDYLLRKKLVRDRLLAERVGDIELQQNLTKFFKPLTKSQKEIQEEATKKLGRYQLEAARRITEGLTPIREGIQQLPGVITEGLAPIREGIIQLPVQLSKEVMLSQLSTAELPSYHEVKIEKNEEEIKHFVEVFNKIFTKKYKKNDFDDTYRIVFDKDFGIFKFGNKEIFLDPNDKGFFYFEEKRFPASDGLWELILSKNPKNFTNEDKNNYQEMLYLSDIMYENNNRENDMKNYNIFSEKWKNIINPVFDYIKKEKAGKGLKKKEKNNHCYTIRPKRTIRKV